MSGTEGNLRTGIPEPVMSAPLVRRPRLTKMLLSSPPARLVLLDAPAGYSKTTCLSEWAAEDERPAAWVTCERRHDDPVDFASATVAALEAIEPLDPEVSSALSAPSPDIPAVVLPRLRDALEGRAPFILVVDDLHLVEAAESLEFLRAMTDALPPGSQMALASRGTPDLPLGRARANRELIEVAQRELALTPAETGELLENLGLRLTAAQVEVVHECTEGWPAATYLAGLALADQPRLAEAVESFAGDDRFIVDYLSEEFIAGTSVARMRFMTRSALLDELGGPVCDAVLDRKGSARILKELSRTNSMVVCLDRSDNTYRYHQLFAELLVAELRRREPELEPEIHRRASDWYAEHGDHVRAIDHAIAADDVDRAGELMWLALPGLSGRGRVATLRAWLDQIGEDRVRGCSALALTEAHCRLAVGKADQAPHWARVAIAAADAEPEGRERIAADIHVLDATMGASGAASMEADAARASELHPPESPWQAPSLLYRGVASHLGGHPERATPMLKEAVRRGAAASPVIQALALAQLCLIATDDDDATEAIRLIQQARRQVERCGMRDYGSMLGIYAASAMVLAGEGRVERARSDAEQAAGLLDRATGLPPWYDAQYRIVQARTLIRLDMGADARDLVSQASELVELTPDAVVLRTWLHDARGAMARASTGALAADARLTRAELRTLQYLPSHLSFREIGEAIHVSPNTVKTQAQAAYRKLGARSRAEAVERARGAGLLSGGDRAPV